ncbi:formimidoylglutamase [Mangrovitalea sediminis]|uniref:formimidoylglutamase n=1 Tax=Mangrovitalea sediminis TaxID=1982043 RepID=UPI000BE50CD8|nr:formimidoylglutamase [Mangrovitalea sediminis]
MADIDMTAWQGRIDPEPDSLRWHQHILPLSHALERAPGLALLGFASDAGVLRNQGRPGAALGPQALRRALANLALHRAGPVYDAGDIHCHGDELESAQEALGERVSALLDGGHFPLVLGGGHEVAFGSWLGLARHLGQRDATTRLGIINFDAHFDLRDPATVRSSGTPFAQIAQQCEARGWPFHYACLGVSRASNTRALFQRAQALGVMVREDHEMTEAGLNTIARDLERFIQACDHLYLTIDLDVLPACEAPGVSAPAARGVPLSLLEPLIEIVRDSGKLRLTDFAELNPDYDIDGRTAKAAARLIHLVTLTG